MCRLERWAGQRTNIKWRAADIGATPSGNRLTTVNRTIECRPMLFIGAAVKQFALSVLTGRELCMYNYPSLQNTHGLSSTVQNADEMLLNAFKAA